MCKPSQAFFIPFLICAFNISESLISCLVAASKPWKQIDRSLGTHGYPS